MRTWNGEDLEQEVNQGEEYDEDDDDDEEEEEEEAKEH